MSTSLLFFIIIQNRKLFFYIYPFKIFYTIIIVQHSKYNYVPIRFRDRSKGPHSAY